MVPVMSLWLPILLSAVVVFIVSSIVHMVLGYHKSDYQRLPDENAAMTALRSLNIAPGDYYTPYAQSSAEMKDPAFLEKLNTGPRVVMTVLPRGAPNMGVLLGKWFVYLVFVSLFAAYVAGRTLAPGANYLAVFRVAGTVAFCSYALGLWQAQIWFGKSTNATIKGTFDGFVYALFTGGVFGWLWPS